MIALHRTILTIGMPCQNRSLAKSVATVQKFPTSRRRYHPSTNGAAALANMCDGWPGSSISSNAVLPSASPRIFERDLRAEIGGTRNPGSALAERIMSGNGPTASVKVCGCRPHDGGAARTGPAYANLQWRKPREVWRGGASNAMGGLAAVSASTTFAIWHELCEWVKTPFAAPVISES
jgi:hypothetical protein